MLKKRSVDSPHLLHSPTTYLGEEMGFFFKLKILIMFFEMSEDLKRVEYGHKVSKLLS
jgi:hypothetical protein